MSLTHPCIVFVGPAIALETQGSMLALLRVVAMQWVEHPTNAHVGSLQIA